MNRSMSRRRFLGCAAVVLGVLLAQRPTRAGSNELVIVLNEKNAETPDLAAAKKLFIGDTTFWRGNIAVHIPVRPADSAPGDAFYHAISVAPARFKRLWQENQLSGQGT